MDDNDKTAPDAPPREQLAKLLRAQLQDGSVAATASGTRYRLSNIHNTPMGRVATIHREIPKIKGKAARKADRRARREAKR